MTNIEYILFGAVVVAGTLGQHYLAKLNRNLEELQTETKKIRVVLENSLWAYESGQDGPLLKRIHDELVALNGVVDDIAHPPEPRSRPEPP